MKKYFNKSESEYIINLLESTDVDCKLLGLNFLETHPLYKNFKKLYIFRGRALKPYFIKGITIKVFSEINRCKRYLNNKSDSNTFRYYMFADLCNFIKRRTHE